MECFEALRVWPLGFAPVRPSRLGLLGTVAGRVVVVVFLCVWMRLGCGADVPVHVAGGGMVDRGCGHVDADVVVMVLPRVL